MSEIDHADQPPSEPASRYVPLGTGLTYHVLEWDARASDHTVVLLHGFLDSAWGFSRVVSAGLSQRFHILAPDMRGHGDSDRIGAGGYYHFMDYVADVDELVRALGRRRVSFIGHSMGGTIASYYAGAFSDAVHRLALLEGLGPPCAETPMPERIRGWIEGWRRARTREPTTYASLEEAAARLRARDRLLDEAQSIELAGRATRATPGGRLRFKHDPLHLTTGPYPFRVDLAEPIWRAIRAPTLIIHGGESELPLSAAESARRVANFRRAREEVLPGAGHMMQRHEPRALAALLAPFLAEADARDVAESNSS